VIPKTKEGQSHPLGATLCADGTNFSVYSKHAAGIELPLFDGVDDAWPKRVISIDPATNRTYHYWHVFVPGVKAGQIYGYRVNGPFDPLSGMRFDSSKVLVDPFRWNDSKRSIRDNRCRISQGKSRRPGNTTWRRKETNRTAAISNSSHGR
jgi:glycogen operon protein